MSSGLTRIVSWGHELLAEVVSPGDLVVDLTAGNGHDTLKLAHLVGPGGQVIAFDIQQSALDATRTRLTEMTLPVRDNCVPCKALERQAGIDLVLGSHAFFADVVPSNPVGVIANLGYFPGGDKTLITLPTSTLAALQVACEALVVGGRMAIAVYSGHPGGDVEAEAVSHFFSELNQDNFQVLLIRVQNRPQAPFLLVAEKKSEVHQE